MNPSSKLSLQQLAAKLGFAKSTVSMALHNDPRVAARTRAKIQQAAKDVGYVADADLASLMAQIQLRRPKPYQANLAIFPIIDTHVSTLEIAGCRRRAEEMGYRIDVIEDYASCANPAKLLEARGIKGAVFVGWPWREDHFKQPQLKKVCDKFPCSVIAARPLNPPLNSVMSDAFNSMRLATLSLIQLGYQRPLAFINSFLDSLQDQAYTGAFLAVQQQLKTSNRLAPQYIPHNHRDPLKIIQNQRPDCVITHDFALLELMTNNGFKVPQRIGFAHLDLTGDHRKIGVSGIDQNHHLLGETAIDMVVAQIHRTEFGIPQIQKCVLLESRWEKGKTVKQKKLS